MSAAEISRILATARQLLAAQDTGTARAVLAPLLPQPEAAYLAGLAHCIEADYSAARPLLEQAAGALAEVAAVQADWLQCLDRLGEFAYGADAADRACHRHRQVAVLHWLGGMLQLKAGYPDRALAACRRAVQLAVDSADAWLWLSRAQRETGQVASAAQSLQRLTTLAPDVPEYRIEHAEALLDLGEGTQARAALQAVVDAQPQLPVAHVALAELLVRQGELPSAAIHAQRACELLPDDPRALSARSLVLRLSGHTAAAAQDALASALARFAPQSEPEPLPRELRDTTAAKLRHDIEQLAYLQEAGLFEGAAELATDLGEALAALPESAATRIQPLPAQSVDRLQHRYNRLHVHRPAQMLPAGAINPELDGDQIERRYRQQAPGIVWIDGLLTADALVALRQYCLDSTFWFDFNHAGGYLGALFQNGFTAPLLLQIADGLRTLMPNVIGDLPLTQLWAFKYDSRLQGIDLHADVAAVNVNFWITPDSANLDPAGGGLELWDRAAPADWDFADYNSAGSAGQQRIRRFLGRTGAQAVRVPYRCNRAVIFNSDLFHRTDSIHFAPGYCNRRINVTLLFGARQGRTR